MMRGPGVISAPTDQQIDTSRMPGTVPTQLSLVDETHHLSSRPSGSRSILSRDEVQDVIGTDDERRDAEIACRADGYDVDAVLSASAEFRTAVIPPYGRMSRGEALHIVRALRAIA